MSESSESFFRFPHTPHLAWLGAGQPRDDKVFGSDEARAFLAAGEVVLEEKVDGANLGFSVTEEGELRLQNRGSYLTPESAHPQFKAVWSWLKPHEHRLVDALWPDLMLFGEWLVAVHSLRYARLPDWFLGFDVYDRASGTFWSTERRNGLLEACELAAVAEVGRGRFGLGEIEARLGTSHFGDGPMEGIVVRREEDGRTVARAKLVRAEFVQQIGEHWSRGPLVKNTLASRRG